MDVVEYDVHTRLIVERLGKLAEEKPAQFLRILRSYPDHLRLLGENELTYQGKVDLEIALGLS